MNRSVRVYDYSKNSTIPHFEIQLCGTGRGAKYIDCTLPENIEDKKYYLHCIRKYDKDNYLCAIYLYDKFLEQDEYDQIFSEYNKALKQGERLFIVKKEQGWDY